MQAIVLTPNQLQNLMFQASPLENLSIGDAQDNLMNLGAHISEEKAELMKAALKIAAERKANAELMNLGAHISEEKAELMKAALKIAAERKANGELMNLGAHISEEKAKLMKAALKMAAERKAKNGLMNLQLAISAADKASLLKGVEEMEVMLLAKIKAKLASGAPMSAEHQTMIKPMMAKLEKQIADWKASQAGLVNLQQTLTAE
jgi:hypothetical protein